MEVLDFENFSRYLELISILVDQNSEKGIGLMELAEKLQLPPSTIHRLLNNGISLGIVQQKPYEKRYIAGGTILSIAFRALRQLVFRPKALQQMKQLTEVTGEDSYLTIASGYCGIFIDRVSGPHHLKIVEPLLEEMPLHCGATRKVLLAFSDEEFIRQYIRQPLKSYTPSSITNPKQLLKELETIRNNGYSVSRGERWPEAVGIGAPICGLDGTVLAAIGIVGPAQRLSEEAIEKYIPIVIAAGKSSSL